MTKKDEMKNRDEGKSKQTCGFDSGQNDRGKDRPDGLSVCYEKKTNGKRQGEDRDRNDWLRLCVIYENYWWACRTVVRDKCGRLPSRRECVGPGRRRRVVAWLTIRGPRGEGMPSPLRCLVVITVLR